MPKRARRRRNAGGKKTERARAERTLSGREMAGIIASSRGNDGTSQSVVKREKHGLFHSLKKHDRKSQDFAETFDNSFYNGQTNALEGDQNGDQSVLSRVSAFEKLSSTTPSGSVQKAAGNHQNGTDFQESRTNGNKKGSITRGSELKARTSDANSQRPFVDHGDERPSTEQQFSTDINTKQLKSTAIREEEHAVIKPTKAQAVMSENLDSFNDITGNAASKKPPRSSKKSHVSDKIQLIFGYNARSEKLQIETERGYIAAKRKSVGKHGSFACFASCKAGRRGRS